MRERPGHPSAALSPGGAPHAARAAPALRLAPPHVWVWLAALAWFACTASMRTLFLPDEGRYVGVAWEMVRSGHWLTPTLDGLPFFHKPPLFYWITAAALQLFGPSEWAARLASIGSASLTVMATYLFYGRWWGGPTARWTAYVLASQPMFFVGAQFANMDMLVASCISLTVLLAAHAALLLESARPHRLPLAGAYAFVGLGILAKGLIGLVLPGLVVLIWLGAFARWSTVRGVLWWPGMLLAAAIAVPWLALMQSEHPAFLHYFFVVQHFQRFAQTGFNSAEPFWFYAPVLVIFVLPWSLWLYRSFARRSAPLDPATRLRSLAWIWVGVVVVFFSMPESKLLGYVLPALVPLAFLVVHAAQPLRDGSPTARRCWVACAMLAPAICVSAVVKYALDNPKSSRELAQAVASAHQPSQRIALLDEYAYDLGFYLRDTPVVDVIADWDPAKVVLQDDWRKELANAGNFAPDAARERLLSSDQLRDAICAKRVGWALGGLDQVAQFPYLVQAPRIVTHENRALWRLDGASPALRAALGCPNLPAPGAALAP